MYEFQHLLNVAAGKRSNIIPYIAATGTQRTIILIDLLDFFIGKAELTG